MAFCVLRGNVKWMSNGWQNVNEMSNACQFIALFGALSMARTGLKYRE